MAICANAAATDIADVEVYKSSLRKQATKRIFVLLRKKKIISILETLKQKYS